MAVINEFISSRSQTSAIFDEDNSQASFTFVITNAASEVEARQLLNSTKPTGATGNAPNDKYNGMPRTTESLQVTENSTVYYGTITYRSRTTYAQSFDTSGGVFNTKQSFDTEKHAKPGLVAPDYKGAINPDKEGNVAGVDIVVPQHSWTETHEISNTIVTNEYIRKLAELTGTTNKESFRDFEPGEVLFLGASSSHRGSTDWLIEFKFQAEINKENEQIGDITGISKKGHEYLWVKYREDEDTAGSNRKVVIPEAVYVERVYEESDFADLQLPV